jgi:hypothetical protein
MKLSLTYDWSCTPEEFWALYFDPDFAVRMYLESLRYGQKPNMPGPVRKIFGEEVITTEVSTFDPASSTSTFVMTPGTMGDKTDIRGSIAFSVVEGKTVEAFNLEAKVKIFGVGPVVERFIESQARATQDKSVAFMRDQLAG